eukprot:1144048-Prymnesium_polylepis.1
MPLSTGEWSRDASELQLLAVWGSVFRRSSCRQQSDGRPSPNSVRAACRHRGTSPRGGWVRNTSYCACASAALQRRETLMNGCRHVRSRSLSCAYLSRREVRYVPCSHSKGSTTCSANGSWPTSSSETYSKSDRLPKWGRFQSVHAPTATAGWSSWVYAAHSVVLNRCTLSSGPALLCSPDLCFGL